MRTFFRSLLPRTATGLAAILCAGAAQAHYAFYFTASGDGTQVVPPSGAAGTIDARFVFDGITYVVNYDIVVSGLSGAATSTDVAGYASPGSNGSVVASLPVGRHVNGTFQSTQAELTSWLANQAYVSIPTSAFPQGALRAQIVLTNTPVETDFCLGDGNGTPCPCGNSSGFGTYSGCASSLGYGAILRAHNIASVSCDTLKMHVLLVPSTATVLTFHGTTQVNGGYGVAFGDGLRCVGGSVTRLATKFAVNGQTFYPDVGETAITTRIGVHTAGYVSYFQSWYRNAASFCTASTFNLTNGSAVTWVP